MTPAFAKRAKRTLLAATLASLLLGGAVQAQSYAGTQPVDRIAAVVNEDVILRSELDRAIANIRSQYAGKEAQLPPADVLNGIAYDEESGRLFVTGKLWPAVFEIELVEVTQ